jgi:DNA-binding transcriptional ArsR family regulator
VLKEAGLVAETRVGTRRYYRVRSEGLAELRGYVERFWEEALASFKEAAEKGKKNESENV